MLLFDLLYKIIRQSSEHLAFLMPESIGGDDTRNSQSFACLVIPQGLGI